MALLALALWNVYTFFWPSSGARLNIPYSAFIQQVEGENVSSVTIRGQRVSGTFTEEVRVAGDQVLSPGDPVPPGTSPNEIRTGTQFQTTIPENSQTELVPLLQSHGVTVKIDQAGGSVWPSLLATIVPLFLFIGLMVYLGRSMSRGQQNVFSFGRSKARVYDAERPRVTFADVAGEEEAKAELSEVVDFLRNPMKYHAIGARLPRGILLVGPPGTGKTLLARAVAGEAGVPFFSVSASEFVEMFVGVGASRVRDLFERAKASAPSIMFVDELDAVGRQRFAGLGGGNDEREQTLNQLLVEMDGFEPHQDVIVIAATNRPDVLDPALLRPGRFDRQVTVGLPDRRGREAILRIHTRGIPVADDLDLEELAAATPGFSGADLANLVNEAALMAARKNKKIVERIDFDEALDKIVLGTERAMIMSEHDKRVVAYHEAGHAVAAHFSPGTDPLRKVSIVPRGQSLGVTIQAPEEDRFNYSRAYLLARLTVMMGGRAAEKLVFNEMTTGAQNDLKEATLLARRMVGLWGMSDEVGPVYLGMGEQHVFLGREIMQDRDVAEATLERADEAVQRLLREAMERAEQLLRKYRDKLDALAEALIAEETIGQEKITEILGAPPVPSAAPAAAADSV
ncbi:ATP-dependent zinc metalloprotease FtsH [Sphaerobacter thermophilus]|uniref:ATP-dependent zinc metalloprotease FtsH n=1 Tax=Sphaerobacter thermophilus TaxID=2057 RepID=UPI0001A357C9|nr:ATP-dependent zinc metalloprotease FtsH [Sphaerobacter thermophilus]